MALNFEQMNSNGTVKRDYGFVKFLLLGIIVIILMFSAFRIVPAGHTGVVVTLGKVSNTVLQEGFHVKIPFIQQVEIMSNKIQVYETPASAVSKDLQSVSSIVAVNYRIKNESSASIYKNIGQNYETVLIMQVVQESVKSVTAKYTAEQLITERAIVGEEIKGSLDSKLNDYGFFIEKLNIVNFDFSSEFNAAIEAKQVAEQNLIKTKTEQEQAIVIANAEAEKKIIAANAEAEAILKQATAQAEANRMLEESLSAKVLTYEKISKWDGVLPKVTGDSDLLVGIDIEDISSKSPTSEE